MREIAFEGRVAKGTVTSPPSKSHTHRAIVLAALSGGGCHIGRPLISPDTEATMDAMRSMGAEFAMEGEGITVSPSDIHAPDGPIHVGNSGTTLRLMTGIASIFGKETVLTGDGSILGRPMWPLLDALSHNGVRCSSDDGRPPIVVKGPVMGDSIVIDGSISSQFVSSLMISSPLTGRRMDILLDGVPRSRPYIDVTFTMMRHFGADIVGTGNGYRIGPRGYVPTDYDVPSDSTSTAFPLVAGALGGDVTVLTNGHPSERWDDRLVDILTMVGMGVELDDDRIRCVRTGRPRCADIDMSDIPDLFPIVSVLLSTAKGRSRLYGAPHLRFKESDRISTVTDMVSALGGIIVGTDDGCVIDGVERLRGGRIEHHGDHRIMMSAAIASLVCDGPVTMDDDGCWGISYPGFVDDMSTLGLRCG